MGFIMKKQVHVFYSGRVQGVGFRLTVEETANHYRVVGWVKNLPDKRVEVVVEGEEKRLIRFLDALRMGSMKNFIHDVNTVWNSSSESYSDFQVRYY